MQSVAGGRAWVRTVLSEGAEERGFRLLGVIGTDGADGSFNFTGLPPGEYYAIAVSRFEVKTMSGLERMREIVRDATTVYLEDGGAASIQLKAPIKLK